MSDRRFSVAQPGHGPRIDDRATKATRARYDRTALFYDLMDVMGSDVLRRRIVGQAQGRVLEIGVGTGKNLPLYGPDCDITGIDLSPGMLARARSRLGRVAAPARLLEMDAQRLEFADASFDTVLATFVFCSVPNPILGLHEAMRVCRPDGRILLLEHVRSDNPALGRMMDWLDPLVAHTVGSHINRKTVDNARQAGIAIESITDVLGRIVKLIVGRPRI